MSLHADALGRALGLDGHVIHLSGPHVPVSDETREKALAVMGLCCMGVAVYGEPEKCTCWTPIFDLEQMSISTAGIAISRTRSKCCGDCAYRHGSPERSDEYVAEALLDLPAQPGRVFACHQGMRRVVSWEHPSGLVIPAGEGDYRPPVEAGVAYRADGTPADLCAGWAALR